MRAACMAGLCAILPATSSAQPARAAKPIVSDADVERAARAQPAITDQDIERAANKHRMPTDAELARVPVPATPRLDALPRPLPQRPVDLAAIARGFEATAEPAPSIAALNAGPTLLAFVSFSMPEATLVRLVDQAARARATLVLRGLVDGSLQQTVQRVQRLISQRQVAFQIDPQAFDRFSITATPTFVLLKAGAVGAPCSAGTCFAGGSYVAVSGDVSIDHALEHVARMAPAFGREAASLLATMKKAGR
jgi:conjugal transfer pilus assembly protein TrbC